MINRNFQRKGCLTHLMKMPMSHLLRAVEHLDQGSLSSVLLPLLDNSTSKSLALVCKPLRDLCLSSQTRLQFSDGGAIALVPERFPRCSRVDLTITRGGSLHALLPDLLPLLTRLGHLSQVRVHMEQFFPEHLVVLQLLTSHLASLQTLHIDLEWNDPPWNSEPWAALAGLTNLKQLSVTFACAQAAPFRVADLTALAPLRNSLQHLELFGDVNCSENFDDLDCSCMHQLTQLTHLTLPIDYAEDLSPLASCTNLRCLRLRGFSLHEDILDKPLPCLGWKFSSSLRRLALLTELSIRPYEDDPCRMHPCLWQALGQLTALQSLELLSFHPSAVTVLTGLTNLTSIEGVWMEDPKMEELQEWQQEQDEEEQDPKQPPGRDAWTPAMQQQRGPVTGTSKQPETCLSVQRLRGPGSAPLVAFPGLTSLAYGSLRQPNDLVMLSDCCKGLQELVLTQEYLHWFEKDYKASLASSAINERVAAVRKLTTLQHLTRLHFSVNSDSELAALVELQQVQDLFLAVPGTSSCCVQALMLLSEMAGLRELDMRLPSLERMALSQSQMQMLIRALCRVHKVRLGVGRGVVDTVLEARASAMAIGLRSPRAFEVYEVCY